MRDIDHSERAFRIKAAVWALPVGLGAALITQQVTHNLLLALLAFLLASALVAGVTLFLVERSAGWVATLYQPSGSSTPAVRQYSHADSLIARGLYQAGVDEYERLGREFPDDPEPRLRQARALRDHLHEPDRAVQVFKQLLLTASLKPETELVVLREIVEIHLNRHGEPRRALPYLARIAEKFAGTPTADWARAETREIKAGMQHE